MKTKLLKKIRSQFIIEWSKSDKEWELYFQGNFFRCKLYHHDFSVVFAEAIRSVLPRRRADKLNDRFFDRTLSKSHRVFHRNKTLKRKSNASSKRSKLN